MLFALLSETFNSSDKRNSDVVTRKCGRGTTNAVTLPAINWWRLVQELSLPCQQELNDANWRRLKTKIMEALDGPRDVQSQADADLPRRQALSLQAVELFLQDRSDSAGSVLGAVDSLTANLSQQGLQDEPLPILPVHPEDCPAGMPVTWPLALTPDYTPLTFTYNDEDSDQYDPEWTCVEHNQFSIQVGCPGQGFQVNEEVGTGVCHHSVHATLAEAQAAVLALVGDKPAVAPPSVGTHVCELSGEEWVPSALCHLPLARDNWYYASEVEERAPDAPPSLFGLEDSNGCWGGPVGDDGRPLADAAGRRGRWLPVHAKPLPAPAKPLPALAAFAASCRADLNLLQDAWMPGWGSCSSRFNTLPDAQSYLEEKFMFRCSLEEFRFFLRAHVCQLAQETENFASLAGVPVWTDAFDGEPLESVIADNWGWTCASMEQMGCGAVLFEGWSLAQVHVYRRAWSWGINTTGAWLVEDACTMLSQEEVEAYLSHLQTRHLSKMLEGAGPLHAQDEDGFTQEALAEWVRENAPEPFKVSGNLRAAAAKNPGCLTDGYRKLADELDASWLGVPVKDIRHYDRVVDRLKSDRAAGGAA